MGKMFVRGTSGKRVVVGVVFLLAALAAGPPQMGAQNPPLPADLQWIAPTDGRLAWGNVADWEPRDGGLQPVRVPQSWRARWPERTASRAQSAAGMAVRFRTSSRKIVFRLTLLDIPERPGPPEVLWERSRPSYFDVYRDGKYFSSIAAAPQFTEQDVKLFEEASAAPRDSEFMILLPFYYRNAEVVFRGIGVDRDARVAAPAPDNRPRVLFHGDSITHGHGVTSPRETYVWRACELAGCVPFNLGFGGSAWGDKVVADYITTRTDWDVLVLAIGTNSFGGADSAGQQETAEQYAAKYRTFVSTIRSQFPAKPILCLTPIWNRADTGPARNRNGQTPQDYRDAIARTVKDLQKTDRNLHLLDGLALINDPLYMLVTDRIHPNMAGSLRMADGVAAALKTLLTSVRTSTAAGRQ